MMAMDVVDTLRHGETLVERELSADQRRAKMIERLREIYKQQGIAVPDRILEEGVAALEQDRFVYKPRTGGFAFTLARLYVRRGPIGKRVGIAVAVIVALFAGWQLLIVQPSQRAAESLRIELAETIPADLQRLAAAIADEAVDPAVAAAAAVTARDGTAAAAGGGAAAARAAVAQLETTLAELRLTFEVRIVNEDPASSPTITGRAQLLIIKQPAPTDGSRSITRRDDPRRTRWGVRVTGRLRRRGGCPDDGMFRPCGWQRRDECG
jgi:hypothetical protein